jgi:DNA-binding beta-propeller fold protein YncE
MIYASSDTNSVMDNTNNTVIATIHANEPPLAIEFYPANNSIYVANVDIYNR